MKQRQIYFDVKQGIIHINSIQILQSTKEVICFFVDFTQKYPYSSGWQNDDHSISFYASEDTLFVRKRNAKPTVLRVKNLPDWAFMKSSVQMERYSATVILVKEEPDYWNKFKHWKDRIR